MKNQNNSSGYNGLTKPKENQVFTATTEKKPRKEDKQKGAGEPAPIHRLIYFFSFGRLFPFSLTPRINAPNKIAPEMM